MGGFMYKAVFIASYIAFSTIAIYTSIATRYAMQCVEFALSGFVAGYIAVYSSYTELLFTVRRYRIQPLLLYPVN